VSEEYDEDDDFYDRPSKSQRKREAHAAQELGEQLVTLKEQQIRSLDLPENLLQAILQAKTIKAHGGRKRQLQYIGKLMRQVDLEPIMAQLDGLTRESRQDKKLFHEAEQWRDRLLEDPSAFEAFMDSYPTTDKQQLALLVKQASDLSTQKKYKRLLFRFLSQAITAN